MRTSDHARSRARQHVTSPLVSFIWVGIRIGVKVVVGQVAAELQKTNLRTVDHGYCRQELKNNLSHVVLKIICTDARITIAVRER